MVISLAGASSRKKCLVWNRARKCEVGVLNYQLRDEILEINYLKKKKKSQKYLLFNMVEKKLGYVVRTALVKWHFEWIQVKVIEFNLITYSCQHYVLERLFQLLQRILEKWIHCMYKYLNIQLNCFLEIAVKNLLMGRLFCF